MEDRNKDLPLIVSEILIEMHAMKEALNRVASIVLKQQEHMNAMFNTLLEENKKNMVSVTSIVTDVQRENTLLIDEVRRAGQEDRQFMTYSFNKALGQQQQVNTAFEQRLTALEAKYSK